MSTREEDIQRAIEFLTDLEYYYVPDLATHLQLDSASQHFELIRWAAEEEMRAQSGVIWAPVQHKPGNRHRLKTTKQKLDKAGRRQRAGKRIISRATDMIRVAVDTAESDAAREKASRAEARWHMNVSRWSSQRKVGV